MGGWNDPALRASFGDPVRILQGNPTFHEANLNYLTNWLKDYPAARKAAGFYKAIKGRPGQMQQARVELAAGDKERARHFLGMITPGDSVGLARASHHAAMADFYMELGDLDEAERHVKLAAEIDDWKGDVIVAMGDLAVAKGNHARGLAEFERCLERYGPSDWLLLRIARCHRALGDTKEAVNILSSFVTGMNKHRMSPSHAIELLRLHVDADNKHEAEFLFDRILTGTRFLRGNLHEACEVYAKLDAERAKSVQDRLDEIMRGPSLFFPDGPPAGWSVEGAK